jgi:hypothetical protein
MALKHQNIKANGLTLRYGSLTIRTLRESYGSFAPHCADSEVLPDLDAASLTRIVRDYKSGRIEKICQQGRIALNGRCRSGQTWIGGSEGNAAEAPTIEAVYFSGAGCKASFSDSS